MSYQVKIWIIAIIVVAVALIIKFVLSTLFDKGANAVENAIAKKKNENETNEANKEKSLSDLYKDQ